MQCPKCGYRQHDENECEKCGIIFSKFSAFKEKQEKHEAEARETSSKTKSGWLLATILITGICAGGVFYFKGQGETPNQQSVVTETALPAKQKPSPEVSRTPPNTKREVAQQKGRGKASMDGLAGQLAESYPTGNSVEYARNATVSIVSPWGSGAGFFIDSNGTIITNRHVVEFDPEQLKLIKSRASELKARLDNERNYIDLSKRRLGQIRDTEIRNQVAKNIQLREEQFAKYVQHYTDLEEQITSIEENPFSRTGKIVLIDGTEYQVGMLKLSPIHDLALLSVLVYNSPYIMPVGINNYPDQGQKVYTIGSPAGLFHTVTSGIISGYRKYKGVRVIQTDAPINPGNSGGPLIDEKGRVLGVNTMILNNTEGIGFAIPMSTVMEAFPELDG